MLRDHSFAVRLNKALDEMPSATRPPPKGHGRQQYVAKMFGVSQKGARKWLEGEALPRTNRIPAIAARCQVRGEWLLTGHGLMRLAESDRATIAEQRGSYRVTLDDLVGRIRDAAKKGALTDDDLVDVEGLVLWLIGRRSGARR